MEQQIQVTFDDSLAPIMSIKDGLVTLLLKAISFFGFMLIFDWAFDDEENPD